jgi:hypothetical protein
MYMVHFFISAKKTQNEKGQRTHVETLCITALPATQEKSFDLGSADPRGSPTVVNLWLETDVFHLIKSYAQLKPYHFDKVNTLPPQRPWAPPRSKLFA